MTTQAAAPKTASATAKKPAAAKKAPVKKPAADKKVSNSHLVNATP